MLARTPPAGGKILGSVRHLRDRSPLGAMFFSGRTAGGRRLQTRCVGVLAAGRRRLAGFLARVLGENLKAREFSAVQAVCRNEGVRSDGLLLSKNEEETSLVFDAHLKDGAEEPVILFFCREPERFGLHIPAVFDDFEFDPCARSGRRAVFPETERRSWMSEEITELLADYRPACTLWRKSCGGKGCVFVLQSEGGALQEDDMRAATRRILDEMVASDGFSTLYDLTEGIQNLMRCAPGLLEFGREQRRLCASKQGCTVIVCPNEQTRNWVRWITSVIPDSVRVYIVKDVEEGWAVLQKEPENPGGALLDSFGDDFETPLSASFFAP